VDREGGHDPEQVVEVLPEPVRQRLIGLVGPHFEEQFQQLTTLTVPNDEVDEAPGETVGEPARRLISIIAMDRVPARLERNLARKGIWHTNPDRDTQEVRWTTEDVVGSLTIDYTMGQLSVADMELVSWIMGRWTPASTQVRFYLRECASQMGVTWGGTRAAWLTEALRRIDRTRFTGRVWEEKSHKFLTRHFGVFDDVQIAERRESFDSPAVEPGEATVTVTLSTFMHEQLTGHHFVRLDWEVMRGKLKTPLGRRLYAFVESQKGWNNGTLYRISIDSKLAQTLGSRDTNLGRFRTKLRKAGEEIAKACPTYREINIRLGATKGSYVLTVLREAA
jgi:hypothetical protein